MQEHRNNTLNEIIKGSRFGALSVFGILAALFRLTIILWGCAFAADLILKMADTDFVHLWAHSALTGLVGAFYWICTYIAAVVDRAYKRDSTQCNESKPSVFTDG